jgi:hypothetical protein
MRIRWLNPYFLTGAAVGFASGIPAVWAVVNLITQARHELALDTEKRRADDAEREFREKCALNATEKADLLLCRDKAQLLDATVCGVKLAKLQAEYATALRNQEILQSALDEKTAEAAKQNATHIGTRTRARDVAATAPASTTGGSPEDKPAVRIEWDTTAQQWCRNVNQTFHFECPAEGAVYNVYGATQYTCKSSICSAAMHAGIVTAAQGGLVRVRMLGSTGKREAGVMRNGIASKPNHALWYTEPSFTFEK